MISSDSRMNPKILVTGGSGFLGKAIVKELLDPASPLQPSLVRIFDLNPFTGLQDDRLEAVAGDIRDASAVAEACRGIDLVIHSAAVVDWGTHPGEEVYSVNVGGTGNVIGGCLEHRVGCLVFTSSLDAVFGGKPLAGIDESLPYPDHHPNMYCRSKCLAEKLVLESNRPGVLATCVLRPADIYGGGDPYHIGSLISMARKGFYVRLGDGSAKSQHVYVGNMAWAHVLAGRSLLAGNPGIAGRVYFITDGPPANFFTFYDRFVEGCGYRIRPKNFHIPRPVAYAMGLVSEWTAAAMRPLKRYTPKFSRFAVIYTCSDFTFTAARAKHDFGFEPKYAAEASFRLTVDHYRGTVSGAAG